jgi:hypothetical protein
MLLVLDHPGVEAPAEEVSLTAVLLVEGGGVLAVQQLHPR